MKLAILEAPEDHPLFDPEDDRATYLGQCRKVDTVDVTHVWAIFWPESVAV